MRSDTCFVEQTDDHRLRAGNDRFTRTWRIDANGLLTAESFHDTTSSGNGLEWLTNSAGQIAPLPAAAVPDEPRVVILQMGEKRSAVEAESLCAELVAVGERLTLIYRLQVFPECAGVRMSLRVEGEGTKTSLSEAATRRAEDAPTGLETDAAPTAEPTRNETDVLESFALAPPHLRLTQVVLKDQTDHHNELVFENEWLLHPSEKPLALPGCLFYSEDVLTGAGLIFLKEAPLPDVRPVACPHDLLVRTGERHLTFAGHGTDATAVGGEGYAFVVLSYRGGRAGRIAALQQYQRCLRPYVPTRDGMLVSNTWGDRNRDARINEAFMAREIEAGARLGVDVVQIDDGWQVGTTSNSVRAKAEGGVWEGFYAATDDFWAIHPQRFPNGLLPLIATAREKGLCFGLWFGPDSAHDFANWERDAETIVRLHRELGLVYFKMDGVKLRSKVGERNLAALFARVLDDTTGAVVFDLDVTAETRPGYFGMMGVGPLFVENRYTDWGKYWPHTTLRNLWTLAHHVDPLRLRMEFLNNGRNVEKYVGDPLAPLAYRPDYLFATVMFSSPLGWFETSNLPKSYFAEAAPLIATWKEHREAIFSGTILPIGNAPDAVAWTGFVSVAPDRRSAYLLVFREASPVVDWQLDELPLVENPADVPILFETLGGDGAAELRPNGLRVHVPESLNFFFGRIALR